MDEFTDVRHVKLKCLGGWPQFKIGALFQLHIVFMDIYTDLQSAPTSKLDTKDRLLALVIFILNNSVA